MTRVAAALDVRDLRRADLTEVIRIDGLHTGRRKPAYWRGTFDSFMKKGSGGRIGLAAQAQGRVIGYLLGEVRAFEFGSEPCGWIFAVGVDPGQLRAGVATGLMEEACRRFRRAGVSTVRTMVRRDDVPVLSFFRASRFAGGTFVQLERGLEEAGR
ncbi:MAG TPA: GNAT family N-acetyltransferase [Candidatus Polarisedimenticolia bacterium]|nr:GNAT family N-acetyltransferase [Candidatus Polarisedimenticolia bacterium]